MSQGMNAPEIARLETPSVVINPEHGLPESFGEGLTGRILFWIAVSFSTFQVVTSFGIPLDAPFISTITLNHFLGVAMALWAGWLVLQAVRGRSILDGALAWIAVAVAFGLIVKFGGSLPSQVVRALHVGFLCLVAGAMVANHRAKSSTTRILGWAIGIAGFTVGLYQWGLYNELMVRSGDLTQLDMVLGIAALLILIYLVWQVMGIALPIVATVFLAYCILGHWLPAPLDHRGYTLEQVIEHMSYGTEGIYAVPTLVSATYIFLFILFGAFMEKAGVIDFFNDISMAAFGSAQGGPGKVCVASSALMGTVSGSGVANVVASGQFTIPLMKRFGYPAAFAGGVEATSSMGGQIMPPVMGAVAFIMAETIDVPYSKIVKAAIVPALLYFAACFLDGASGSRQARPQGPAARRAAQPVDGNQRELVPDPPAGRAGVHAVRRLHAYVCGRGGPGVDGRADHGRRASSRACGAGVADRVLDRVWLLVSASSFALERLARGRGRRCWRSGIPSRERTPDAGPAWTPGRRRAPGAAGGPCLRGRRHRHRHHDADGRRHDLRQLDDLRRQGQHVPRAGADDDLQPDPRHGHPDNSQLHHHVVARRARPAQSRRAADRLAYVRVLLRHHGGPDAAGRAGGVRRGADREGVGDEDRR